MRNAQKLNLLPLPLCLPACFMMHREKWGLATSISRRCLYPIFRRPLLFAQKSNLPVIVLLACFVISGCGGGSGNSDPTIYEVYPPRTLDSTGAAAVRQAAAVADTAQAAARDKLLEAFTGTVTEQDVVDAVLAAYAAAGADAEPCYPPIIASGADALLPNGDLSNDAVQVIGTDNEIVLVGLAPRVHGYCAAMARTYFLGEPTTEMRDIFAATADALDAGIAAVARGVDSADVAGAMWNLMNARGYGAYMTWSPGFGLYTWVHAGPLIAGDYHYSLEPVQALALEPGAIIPGRLGIRLMDTVLLTQDGVETLSAFSRDISDAILTGE